MQWFFIGFVVFGFVVSYFIKKFRGSTEEEEGKKVRKGPKKVERRKNVEKKEAKVEEPLAVIGVGCRFPKAKNKKEFWDMLVNGVSGIVKIPSDRWNADDWYDRDFERRGKMRVKSGGFIEDIDKFDATFFGVNAHEASRMDPQHRLLMEVVYEGFQDSGLLLDEHIRGKSVGVFIGISSHDFSDTQNQITERVEITGKTIVGNSQSIASNRLSYVFDLKGPSYSVDTACSSSAVAMNTACMSLRDGSCEIAVVGGTSVIIRPETTLAFSQGGFLSPDGICKSFDAGANGYIRSEGLGCLILKPLSKAIRDGDRIYTTVLGTLLNQDGKTNGISQPSQEAQEELIRNSYDRIGLDPRKIQFVEAHGTGTKIGDPIEAGAIGNIIGEDRKDTLFIGSVKSNIGHVEPASAVAGLIKCCLSMKHRLIPKNIHFNEPNPEIEWKKYKMQVPVENIPWNGDEKGELYSCINSFGFGGTNGHVILKMSPEYEKHNVVDTSGQEGPYLFTMTARSDDSLKLYAEAFIKYLEDPGVREYVTIEDICFTANVKRDQHRRRVSFIVHSKEELKEHLEIYLKGESIYGLQINKVSEEISNPRMCFVYSGQGPQYFKMGRELYEKDEIFRNRMRRVDEELKKLANEWSLIEELLKSKEESRINETRIAQPAIFAIQVSLTEVWKARGIKPSCVVGHSIGEVAAAWACGHLPFSDAVKVIYCRSKSQDRASGKGKMIAIGMDEEESLKLISRKEFVGKVGIATVNGPDTIVLSGDNDIVEKISEELTEKDIFNKVLRINVPFHSHYMDELEEELVGDLRDLKFQKRKIPYFSTVTGTKFLHKCDGDYWFKNVRRTVQFTKAVNNIIRKENISLFVEISNHPILSKYVEELLESNKKKGIIVPSIHRNKPERASLINSIARLHGFGVKIPLARASPRGRFVDLPLYQFQKQRYWTETDSGFKNRITPMRYGFPLLQDHTRSIRNPNDRYWTVNLDTRIHPFIQDHIVQGECIYPGAGFCELALECALHAFGEEEFRFLEGLVFDRALYLPDDYSKKIQFNLNYYDGEFRVYSKRKGAPEYDHHMSGHIRHMKGFDDFVPEMIDIASLKKTVTVIKGHEDEGVDGWIAVDLEKMYSGLYNAGLMLGPSFQGVKRLWTKSEFFGGSSSGFTVSYIDSHETIQDEVGRFIIHPALLDAAFQSMFGIMFGHDRTPGVYVPIRIGRIKYYKRPGAAFWTFGRVEKFTGNRIVANIWIFDVEDNISIEIQGFTCRYIEGTRGTEENVLDNSMFQYKWKRLLEDMTSTPRESFKYLPNPKLVEKDICEWVHTIEGEDERRDNFYHDFSPSFERVVETYCCEIFEQLLNISFVEAGVEGEKKKKKVEEEEEEEMVVNLDKLRTDAKISEDFFKLFDHMFLYLAKLGYFERKEDGENDFIVNLGKQRFSNDPTKVLKEFYDKFTNEEAFHSYIRYEVVLISKCMPALLGVIQGTTNAVEIMFPESEWNEIVDYYSYSFSFGLYNRIANKAMKQILSMEKFTEDSTLHVLEIGAGTGGLTNHILPALPPERTRYVFTDISKMFLDRAKKRFGEKYPFVVYDVLDIEKDIGKNKKYKPHTFDIIIASDVVHATTSVENTVNNMKRLLAPGGYFIILEVTNFSFPSYCDFVFGMFKGWWLYNDHRTEHPSMTCQLWKDILETKLDFEHVAVLNYGMHDNHSVFVCQNKVFDPIQALPQQVEDQKQEELEEEEEDGRKKEICLIFGENTDEKSISKYLSNVITTEKESNSTKPKSVIIVNPNFGANEMKVNVREEKITIYEINPSEKEQMKQLFDDICFVNPNEEDEEKIEKKNVEITKVVYLWPVYDISKSHISKKTIEDCILLCTFGITNLMQELDSHDCGPRLFFLTNNVFEVFTSYETRGEQKLEMANKSDVGVLGAPVWGFVRALIHEYTRSLISIVDIGTHDPSGDELATIFEVIGLDDDDEEKYEVEYAVRGKNKYVHELTHVTKKEKLKDNAIHMDPSKEYFHSEVETPGVLESIKLCKVVKNKNDDLESDEVEVNVVAAGINYKDVMNAMKLLPEKALEKGYTGPYLGMECTGVVTRVGEDVDNVYVGDPVMCISPDSFSSFVRTKSRYVVPKPSHLSFEEAATLPFAYLTAFYSLVNIGRVEKNERVLIHSATGGVGIAAVRICQKIGCEIFATAGTEEKREYLRKEFGIEHVYDSRTNQFAVEIMKATNKKGVDVVLNSLSGRLIYSNFEVLGAYGRFLELGKTDIYQNNKLGLLPFGNNLSYTAIDVDKLLTQKPMTCENVLKNFVRLCHPLQAHPFKTYKISDITEAFQFMGSSKHLGKVILKVQEDPKKMDSMIERIPISPPSKPVFHPNATYMITGGTKGFGFKVGEYIIQNGGRYLVLFSRSGVTDPEIQKAIDKYHEHGMRGEKVHIYTCKCDVTSMDQLKGVFDKVKELKYPTIRGIVHSVLVLEDGFVINLTLESLRKVMLPKILGIHYLQQLLDTKELDFFVSFSSMTAHWGNPGQSNYTAANTFLEAMTRYQKEVLKYDAECTCVAWGALGESGYVSRSEKIQEIQVRQGWYSISMENATELFGFCTMNGDSKPTVAILAEWAKLKKTTDALENRTVRQARRFQNFFVLQKTQAGSQGGGASQEGGAGKGSDILMELLMPDDVGGSGEGGEGGEEDGPPKEITEEEMASKEESARLRLEDILTDYICRISGLRRKEIDLDEPIVNYGFDSMMTNQLRNFIQSDLGVDYSLMKIMKGISISELSRDIIQIKKEQILKKSKLRVQQQQTSKKKKKKKEEEEEEEEEVEGEDDDDEDEEGTTEFSKLVKVYGEKKDKSGIKYRLICFPYAMNAGASVYSSWNDLLPSHISVLSLQYPSREERASEKPFTEMSELCEYLINTLDPVLTDPKIPFVFYGHSQGSDIAFEMLKMMRNKKKSTLGLFYQMPTHFFLASYNAPQRESPYIHIKDVTRQKVLDDEEVCYRHFRQIGISEDLLRNELLMEKCFESMRADILLGKHEYKKEKKISKDTKVFGISATRDEFFDLEDVESWGVHFEDFKVLEMENAKHLFILEEKYMKKVVLWIEKECRD